VLKKSLKYYFSDKNYLPLHLHTVDLNNNGVSEFLISISKKVLITDKLDSVLCSQILSIKNNKIFELAKNLPYYLRSIIDRSGNKIALAQKKGDYSQYSGPIYKFNWDIKANKFEIGESFEPAKNIYSIYQFNLVYNNHNNVIILEPGNLLHGYRTLDEKIEAYGVRNYGEYKVCQYPIKLEHDQYTIGFENQSYELFFSPRRFEINSKFDWQAFLIYKERSKNSSGNFLNNIWQAVDQKDQVAGVKWEEGRIVEKWTSPGLMKEILDFTFINPGKIVILYRDGKEYAIEIFNLIKTSK